MLIFASQVVVFFKQSSTATRLAAVLANPLTTARCVVALLHNRLIDQNSNKRLSSAKHETCLANIDNPARLFFRFN